MNKCTFLCLLLIISINSCSSKNKEAKEVIPAAQCIDDYITYLNGKNVGLLINHSSIVDGTHLLDTLLKRNINIVKVFAPEHGFRGKLDAGEDVKSKIDIKTGIPVISLYGKNKKPTLNQIEDLDVIVFDIQDVGVRFYTYISTMHYMMEACAEASKKMIILDRPNPNGDYFDGPILKSEFKSFVGMHSIPVVHGLTVGELANMINNEGWLNNSIKCNLSVIKVKNWNHSKKYELPINPSPNLPNYISVRLYPSLCFFEATNVSIGRGTYFPFQVIGYPNPDAGEFNFIPQSIDGMSKSPKQLGKKCYGFDLRKESINHRFTLSYFISFYKKYGKDKGYGLNEEWFNLLAGDDYIIQDIKSGLSETEIRKKWKAELKEFSTLRDKYLLYPKE